MGGKRPKRSQRENCYKGGEESNPEIKVNMKRPSRDQRTAYPKGRSVKKAGEHGETDLLRKRQNRNIKKIFPPPGRGQDEGTGGKGDETRMERKDGKENGSIEKRENGTPNAQGQGPCRAEMTIDSKTKGTRGKI